jgi:hypothetical protein
MKNNTVHLAAFKNITGPSTNYFGVSSISDDGSHNLCLPFATVGMSRELILMKN